MTKMMTGKSGATMTEVAEAAVVSAGRSSGVRPLARNLVDELDDVAKPEPAFGEDDGEDGAKDFPKTAEATIQPTGIRPPLNGDTPADNSVRGVDENEEQLDASVLAQDARETESLLRAMGCESQMYPSTMALADWSPTEAAAALTKWKKKLRVAFGATTAGVATLVLGSTTYIVPAETDPSRVPLPPTPQKGPTM
ncbi:hypothetical protein PR001_g22276 [Phytophthora rubi]|uniref:Transmembrane protein n=1 Tax=Phytophthora rubi TaxID=129364 RepID=A0A6A3IZU5_9STRA|nr:hypothetical protein PR001_g22276 [Phytophthora rubi]